MRFRTLESVGAAHRSTRSCDMLDLLAVGTLGDLGASMGVAVSALLQELMDKASRVTSANAVAVNASMILLGFVMGLCAEIRRPLD
jgi:hypothetical protein